MGMFYIYNKVDRGNPYELIDLKNIWDELICAELRPGCIILHYGDQFKQTLMGYWDEVENYLDHEGYAKAKNYILKDCYPSLSDVQDAVKLFVKKVEQTRTMERLLKGDS